MAPITIRPSPCGAPNHSPSTAPIIAAPKESRAPLAIVGKAAGSSRRKSRRARPAPSTVNRSWLAWAAAANPARAAT